MQGAQYFERCIARLEQWRGLVLRTDKLARMYQVAPHLTASCPDSRMTEHGVEPLSGEIRWPRLEVIPSIRL